MPSAAESRRPVNYRRRRQWVQIGFLVLAIGPLPVVFVGHFPFAWFMMALGWSVMCQLAWNWIFLTLLLPFVIDMAPIEQDPAFEPVAERLRNLGIATPVSVWRLDPGSTTLQAATVGTGANQQVLVTDALLTCLRPDEAVGIIAHEWAHVDNEDVRRQVSSSLATGALLLVYGFLTRLNGPLAGIGFFLLFTVATLVRNAYLRGLELRADARAVTITGDPATYISAMTRVSQANHEVPQPSWRDWWRPHPSLDARVARLSNR